MNILEYLFYNNITKTEMARRLGLHPVYFRCCLNGDKILGWESCHKIEKICKGQITAESMREFSVNQKLLKHGKNNG